MYTDDLLHSDRPRWDTLYAAYAAFYRRPVTPAIRDQVWHWIFDAQTQFFAIAGRNDRGELVGLLHYRAMPSPLRGCHIGFADDWFISPECRNSGLSQLMMKSLRERAAAQGWPMVRWITAADNHRAQAIYDRLASATSWKTYEMDCRPDPAEAC